MADEPLYRRKFQLTNLDGNNNKFWQVEQWPQRTVFTWGRVGDAGQEKNDAAWPEWRVDQKIAKKLAKGYVELDLHKPAVVAPVAGSSDPKVDQLVRLIFEEANERIQTYLASSVNALSRNQLTQGRNLLREIIYLQQTPTLNAPNLRRMVQTYFTMIPTILPRKIDPDQLVADFDVQEQDTRLNQLEAALASYTVQQTGVSQTVSLGCDLAPVPTSHNAYEHVFNLAMKTLKGNGPRIKDLYAVRIPDERKTYDAEAFGSDRVLDLFHGTANPNVRHILMQGLRLPRSAANGWRGGPGIYTSPAAWRSYQYTGSNRFNAPRMMFLCSVKVGKSWEMKGSDSSLRSAPVGFHSVLGTGSWSNRGDEYIVYRASQQTLRCIITLD